MSLLDSDTKTHYMDTVKSFINDHCIHRVVPGTPKLKGKAPGTWYSWQFYPRRAFCNRQIMSMIGALTLDKIYPYYKENPFQIAGLETGGVPLSIATMMTSAYSDISLDSIIVRKEPKAYGLLNLIEGLPNGLPIMMMDDLCSSKNTLIRGFKALTSAGMELYPYHYALINKTFNSAVKDKYSNDLNMLTIFNLSDFQLSWHEYNGDDISVKVNKSK